jgi:tetratricopeptide (TPR) repeat protein
MSKRRTRPSSREALDLPNTIQLLKYKITTEPIHNRRYKRLPSRVQDNIERLHYDSQRRPRKALPELLELVEKYPDVPVLYNYLSVAYSRTDQRKKAEEIVRENYQRNPDYLFARLNYAEICLAKREYEKVAEILEHKFDLKLLYPNRNLFHISEVANFMGLVGVYFFEIGEIEKAEKYYEILQEIAPDFPMTKRLHQKMHPSLVQRLWNLLRG